MDIIVGALAANALVLGVLAYLVKTLLNSAMQRDTDQFKADLESRVEHELVAYRARLETERLRMQISYGGIFEKQADAILTLYKAVMTLDMETSRAVHTGGELAPRKEQFLEAYRAMRREHQEHRILLPAAIDSAIARIADRIFRSALGYMSVEARDLARVSQLELDRLYERQDKAAEILEDEVPKLIELLIAEMRSSIGITVSVGTS